VPEAAVVGVAFVKLTAGAVEIAGAVARTAGAVADSAGAVVITATPGTGTVAGVAVARDSGPLVGRVVVNDCKEPVAGCDCACNAATTRRLAPPATSAATHGRTNTANIELLHRAG
jgi:hypothetical protein